MNSSSVISSLLVLAVFGGVIYLVFFSKPKQQGTAASEETSQEVNTSKDIQNNTAPHPQNAADRIATKSGPLVFGRHGYGFGEAKA